MSKKKQLNQLNRLVHLIADDNELLSRASNFVHNLVDSRAQAHGKHDLALQLEQEERRNRSEGQQQ